VTYKLVVSANCLWLAICGEGMGILQVWANYRLLVRHHEGHSHQQAEGMTNVRRLEIPKDTAVATVEEGSLLQGALLLCGPGL